MYPIVWSACNRHHYQTKIRTLFYLLWLILTQLLINRISCDPNVSSENKIMSTSEFLKLFQPAISSYCEKTINIDELLPKTDTVTDPYSVFQKNGYVYLSLPTTTEPEQFIKVMSNKLKADFNCNMFLQSLKSTKLLCEQFDKRVKDSLESKKNQFRYCNIFKYFHFSNGKYVESDYVNKTFFPCDALMDEMYCYLPTDSSSSDIKTRFYKIMNAALVNDGFKTEDKAVVKFMINIQESLSTTGDKISLNEMMKYLSSFVKITVDTTVGGFRYKVDPKGKNEYKGVLKYPAFLALENVAYTHTEYMTNDPTTIQFFSFVAEKCPKKDENDHFRAIMDEIKTNYNSLVNEFLSKSVKAKNLSLEFYREVVMTAMLKGIYTKFKRTLEKSPYLEYNVIDVKLKELPLASSSLNSLNDFAEWAISKANENGDFLENLFSILETDRITEQNKVDLKNKNGDASGNTPPSNLRCVIIVLSSFGIAFVIFVGVCVAVIWIKRKRRYKINAMSSNAECLEDMEECNDKDVFTE